MLIYRLLTAAVLIPLTLVILFYATPVAFLLITGLLLLGGAWEWSALMGLKAKSFRFIYLLTVLFFMGWALLIPLKIIYTAGLVWWTVALIFILSYPTFSGWWGRGVFVRGLMGLLVLIPCWAALNTMFSQPQGAYALLFLFLLIWGADSFAYFAGRCWGNHKLCPLVSPGKSWEGLAGALIATLLIVSGVLWATGAASNSWPWVMLLSLLTVGFSVVGDLFESMLKRQVGLKDSGRLLPGHGGLLDRIDSLTAAAPVFVAGGLMLSNYLY